jgi:hypothetical protein
MVKVTLSKTTKVLVILMVALILGGSGGYLLWRINQDKTVAPTDSDAGGSGTAGTSYCCRFKCCDGTWIARNCNTTGTYDGICDGIDMKSLCSGNGGYGSCSSDVTIVKCSCKSWGAGMCGVDCTFPSGTKAAVEAAAKKDCKDKVAMCDVSTGTTKIQDYNSSHVCYGKLEECKNPYAPNPCKSATNTCDDGSWKSKPTGTYEYCEGVSYSALGTDSDGIDEASITVKLNNSAKATFDKTSTATTTTITDDLSTTTECLDPGDYTLDITWKDKRGATSTDCALTTTFKVLEEGTPAENDWEISKRASEQCINPGTANPTSVISYVITVTNNAAQEESLDKIIDVLDTKVIQSYLGSISGGGTFASGSITWELEGTAEVFIAGQSKTYTYSVTIPETVFGSYTNTVTGYPKEGENFSDTETILADCVVTPDEQPQTGIFDSTISKVLLGILMIMIGFNLHRISQMQFFFKKLGISLNEISGERRKKNFERKIVKK